MTTRPYGRWKRWLFVSALERARHGKHMRCRKGALHANAKRDTRQWCAYLNALRLFKRTHGRVAAPRERAEIFARFAKQSAERQSRGATME
jgi:hypothetical protein